MQLDVFTLVPHAFAWLTEQRPVATVLGTELDLRLFSYRDTTPLRAGQVDDDPYGGGAGMVLRVDVVAAALDAAYGEAPEHRASRFLHHPACLLTSHTMLREVGRRSATLAADHRR